MPSRRSFMKRSLFRSSLIAFGPTVPFFLTRVAQAAAPDPEGRVLVVVQLDGGNDGINTVVPYADEGYARHRKVLRLPTPRLIKVDDRVGLHPSLGEVDKLLDGGRLAIVQGVGYPNPNRSHFRSMAIWHTGRLDSEGHRDLGWLGRSLDAAPDVEAERDGHVAAPAAFYVGPGPLPVAIRGRRTVASAIERSDDFVLHQAQIEPTRGQAGRDPAADLSTFVQRTALAAYATVDRLDQVARSKDGRASYPATALAGRLEIVSRLLKAGLGTRVYYVSQPGYDTHYAQVPAHAESLSELAGALRAFVDDLAAAKLAERVLVLCFSEFGRRVAENGSAGTDHGTAGPVFLVGPAVRPGLVGSYPSLTDLEDGDLKMAVDFRRVYASVLEGWLSLPSLVSLGTTFKPLPLFHG